MRARPASPTVTSMIEFAAVLIGTIAVVAIFAGRPTSIVPTANDSGAGGQPGNRPAIDVTVTGTVGTQTNAGGETEYTLTTADTTLLLDAGPAWFFGDAYPLAPFVGKLVTIGGERREGSTQVVVVTVDGSALREPGKPPWAGGWKVVGERHPGWSQEKADRESARANEKQVRFGLDCWPPGHCKNGSASDVNPGASAKP